MCTSELLELERALPSKVWGWIWVVYGDAGVHKRSSEGGTRVGILAIQMRFSD